MTLEGKSSLLSIEMRMQKIRTRMKVEKVGGISVLDKERFVALCQQREAAGLMEEGMVTGKKTDCYEMSWKDFDNWHDAPVFTLERRKVEVS